MAKITTIIDIGSNSMRMVVFKKTSRFGFHLINESKSKVKISEGSYENDGFLQEIPLQRTYDALKSFLQISKNLRSRKLFCVATSALRDAPNGKDFVKKVSSELGLNIKIIDGVKEAYYGGVAALNMLPNNTFSTIDIGGGSTEFAIVEDGKIINTYSLQIGTVRIKELFFNKGDLEGAKAYIEKQLDQIKHEIENFVGMGGTARALSRAIIKNDEYCYDVLHNFTYTYRSQKKLFEQIINVNDNGDLKSLGIRKDRFDTIKEGTFIFKTILDYFEANQVTTSGVGVREGVYLTDLLRSNNHKFPANFNKSVRSLLDRFVEDPKQSAYLGNNAKKIFDSLYPLHGLQDKYKSLLVIASKLQPIGRSLNFYKTGEHSFNFILNGLNYGFTHEDRMIVAHIIRFHKKSLPKKSHLKQYQDLLPDVEVIKWLSFMISLNVNLNNEFSMENYEFNLDEANLTLEIKTSNEDLYLVKNSLENIEVPTDLTFKVVS